MTSGIESATFWPVAWCMERLIRTFDCLNDGHKKETAATLSSK
jgi:hypothetical protein